MADAIAFIAALLVAGGGLLALLNWLINSDRRAAERTEEEYETRERGSHFIGAAMAAIDQEIFHRGAQRAVEYRIDAEQGSLPGAEADGEDNPHTNPQ